MRDTVLDEGGEWTEDERAQLASGLNFVVEMIEEELREAIAALVFVRGRMEALPPQLLADGLRAPRSSRDPEWEQVCVRTAVRTTLRGWLGELVAAAESTWLPAEHLPELLRDVLRARSSDENVVVRLAPRKNKYPPPPESGRKVAQNAS